LEAAQAFELAGASAEIVPLNDLRTGLKHWADYDLLCIPGGFSYADALGAGKLLALDMNVYFAEEVRTFVEMGKPVIGICNGFQSLVKAGLLPGQSPATLTFNEQGHFECRWVTLKSSSQNCVWTRDLNELIYCPIAHGEGNFLLNSKESLAKYSDQIALVYTFPDGSPAQATYPFNPNGSVADIAGVCNPRGNVLGLMPHPENHIYSYQHPRWTRGEGNGLGLQLFQNGVNYARNS
jgi:phosphoribosylformylglycinamidine synthase subunit PurQ / glutaminase